MFCYGITIGTIDEAGIGNLHTPCAIIFFVIIAYVCVFRSEDTVSTIDDPAREKRYRKLYQAYGVLMVTLPLLTAALFYLTDLKYTIFAVEWVAVWIFAAFWLTKGYEVKRQAKSIEFELMKVDTAA